jgi:hypothetical protein
VKKSIFQSFPPNWQQQFICSGQQVANTPLSDILKFMSNEKSFTDSQDPTQTVDKKKAFNRNKDSHGDSYKKRKASNGKNGNAHKKGQIKDRLKTNSECPIHGGQTWNTCFDNSNGKNYKVGRTVGCRLPSEGQG